MKKILMLGGSLYQVYAIKEAVRLGYYVISCDYLPNNRGINMHMNTIMLVQLIKMQF